MSADAVAGGPSRAAMPASTGMAISPSKQSLAERMRTDTCFKCQRKGHWARDCPHAPQEAVRCPQRDTDFPVVMCPRGHGACCVKTSSSEKNSNRKYYECSRKRTGGCDFFKWFDEMHLPERVPVCDCGAGKCCVDIVKAGPRTGQWYFTCRVQKGHGACSFFQWEDGESDAPMNESVDGKQGNSQPAGNNCGPSKRLRIESPMMENHNLSPDLAFMPGPSASAPPTASREQKLQTVVRSLDFSAGQGVESGLPTTVKVHHASRLSEAEICPQQSPEKVSAAKDLLNGGSVDAPNIQSGTKAVQTSGLDSQFTIAVHGESSTMDQLVSSLRNSILSFLELEDANDPVSFKRVANSILDALDDLSADSKSFREHVGEFIRCASLRAELEQPVTNEPTLQDFIDRYNTEKVKFDDISRKHSEALDALNASNEEASRLKELLAQIKNQLSCCEMKAEELKTRVDEICREKTVCERSLRTAEEALGTSSKERRGAESSNGSI